MNTVDLKCIDCDHCFKRVINHSSGDNIVQIKCLFLDFPILTLGNYVDEKGQFGISNNYVAVSKCSAYTRRARCQGDLYFDKKNNSKSNF